LKDNNDKDLIEMGKFYFINKKFENAKEMFFKVLNKDPFNYEVIYNIGLCFEAINDTENAIFYYKKTLEINKDYKLAVEHLEKLTGTE
jgi:tetratricopeptide (TPR) repeat protein